MLTTRLIPLSPDAHTHAHGHHQLVLSVDGKAEFEVNGKGGEVCRMRACLVPGDAGHQFAGLGDNRMLIIDFDELDMPEQDQDLLDRLFAQPRYPTLDAGFQHLLRYASTELDRFGNDPMLARGLGGSLLRALHLRLFSEATEQGVGRHGRIDLGRIDAFIARHIGRAIGVSELAQVACLSLSHFHAQFKDAAGMTPHQYLLEARLRHASQLLRDSALPLAQVAEEAGFSSQSALTTAMGRHLGVTPKRLRQARMSPL
jgi:AraC-like DNA-binding protein